MTWFASRTTSGGRAPTNPEAAFAPPAQPAASGGWSFSINALDWLAIFPTILLCFATLYETGVPVLGNDGIFPLDMVWSFVAIVWAYSVYHDLQDDDAVRAGRLLLTMAFASLLAIIPHLILTYFGLVGAVVALALVLVLLGRIVARERPRRVAWLVVPAIVLATFGLVAIDAPRNVRFTIDEPALTAYAQGVQSGALPQTYEIDPIVTVASLRASRVEVQAGCVRFTTAFVADFRAAGIAYCPAGPPPDSTHPSVRYEPFHGGWHRWVSLAR